MAVLSKPSAVTLMPPRAVSRTIRKIALCGSHSASLGHAPWTDPSWEFWGHAAARAWYGREMDRYFDLHPTSCWTRGNRKGTQYPVWLRNNTVPIYMQEKYDSIPASVRYPKERILMEYGGARNYFKNHVAWMIALALSEGVTTLALFGVNYGHQTEYMMQRGSAEYWLGRAEQAGVRVILPEECSLLREPIGLYGYESHDKESGLLLEAYKEKVWKPAQTIAPLPIGEAPKRREMPEDIKKLVAIDEAKYPRPQWSKDLMNVGRTDGELKEVPSAGESA